MDQFGEQTLAIEIHNCSSCKWNVIYDCDPEDVSVCIHICTGSLHYNLINPELSVGNCEEWTPDLRTYMEITGYSGPVPYRYRYLYSRN